jgi:hypothetical protein
MPEIKYVVISDTHFGAATSLLTSTWQMTHAGRPGRPRPPLTLSTGRPHPVKPTPVLTGLVDCLRTLIPKGPLDSKPTLILNGDIFELALSEMNLAAMAFLCFAELIFPEHGEPLFSRIIFLPGNHDHHLWEMARETQYLNYISTPPIPEYPGAPHHATPLFLRATEPPVIPRAHFIIKLLRRLNHFGDVGVHTRTYYPNLGILSDDGKKCIIVHHGHFTERIYYLMSTLRSMLFPDPSRKDGRPPHVWDIEAENFAWIDFIWSTLGRSGKVGPAVDLVFELLHSDKGRKYLVSRLSGGIAAEACSRYVPDAVLSGPLWLVLTLLLGLAADEMESKKTSQGPIPLDPKSRELLKYYIETPLRSQILVSPRPGGLPAPAKQSMPDEVAFLFGHTHKPFQTTCTYEKYNSPVAIHNTGGWIVEKTDYDEDYGGAIVFADADLNTAQVEFYHEAREGASSASVAPGLTATDDSLVTYLQGRVTANPGTWAAFTDAVAKDLPDRRRILQAQQTPPPPPPPRQPGA